MSAELARDTGPQTQLARIPPAVQCKIDAHSITRALEDMGVEWEFTARIITFMVDG